MGVVRNGRGMAIAVVTVGLVQTIAFPSSARAGFFDFFFGQIFQNRAFRSNGAYPGQWGAVPRFRRHADRGFHRHEHTLTARRQLNDADDTDHPGQPPAPVDIMDDDSLRPGDAVMMANGIRIFIGSSDTPHAPQDFRKLSEIKGFSKRERKALAALDAQGSGPDDNSGMATGRSASELKLVNGETIIDPQGRSIRYVGP
ncbi:MAG TPA: hypothetical protein VHT02_07875 [Methylocella sp.]|nr:hypothetical protein [Methylocella sp.]